MSSVLARARLRVRAMLEGPRDYLTETADVEPAVRRIYESVRPHTMTGLLRINALVHAVRHVVRRDIPGAFVECGVWRGGSVLAMLLTLNELRAVDRDIFLYDTFTGMTAPDEKDVSPFTGAALPAWRQALSSGAQLWSAMFGAHSFNLAQVRETLLSTGYPRERLHFIQGDVLQTIPGQIPEAISLLRLDTDWYESTRHELEHLYPRLSPGGVLLIDDYGHWLGCRQAVDEYFSTGRAPPVLLNRVDYTARLAIKH